MIAQDHKAWRVPVVIIAFSFALVAGYLSLLLNHTFLQSDVESYWLESFNWQQPFHPSHVPGYPLLIALARAVTLDTLPAVPLMMLLNFACLMVSIVLVYKLIDNHSQSLKLSVFGALLFGLWPLVGVVYAVIPLADIPTTTFFLLGLYAITRDRFCLGAASWAMVLIIHKALWPVVFFSLLALILNQKRMNWRQIGIFLLILLLPLISLWGSGASYHHDPAWIISSNLQFEVASSGSLHIFGGLLGTFSQGGIRGYFKGMVMLSFTILAFSTLYLSLRYRHFPDFYFGVSISLAILVLFIVLNQYEIWAAVRFSRLLVLPVAWTISQLLPKKVLLRKGWLIAGFGVLFFSQFAYAWYAALFFR